MNLNIEGYKRNADNAINKLDTLIGGSLEQAIECNIDNICFIEELSDIIDDLRHIAVIASSLELTPQEANFL